MRIPCLLLLLIGLPLLGGCERTPDTMLDDYASRVSRVLEQQAEPVPVTLPAFPERRERRLVVEDIRQGLLEVLRLKQCELLDLVGSRNSSLGKFEAPSQRMLYEHRFFTALSRCIQTLPADAPAELRDQLTQIAAIKQRNWPAVVWNALYTSAELEAQFSHSRAALPLQSDTDYESSLRALAVLDGFTAADALSNPGLAARYPAVEPAYQALNGNRLGAELLQSLRLLTATLNEVAAVIEQRLARKPLCYKQRSNRDADILNTVFRLFYAGEVQPYLAQVHRLAVPWIETQQQWLQRLPATPAMQHYGGQLFARDATSLWQRYQQARDRHTQAWQTLLGQCGLMPGS